MTEKGPSYLHGWSPDGKRLAYCAERGGQYDIYSISVNGGPETQLTDLPGLDDGPEYSPDGRSYLVQLHPDRIDASLAHGSGWLQPDSHG